jgi:hypothetical protein
MPPEALRASLTYAEAYAISLSKKMFARFRIQCDYTFLAHRLPMYLFDYTF